MLRNVKAVTGYSTLKASIAKHKKEIINMKDHMTLSKYMYETVSIGSTNQLPISSVCNARCIFCSNEMNPFKIYREGFRPLGDVKRGIALLDANNASEIRLGDSLPGRISEGEALLHPELFTILKLIRKKAPKRVIQANTNGTMLTKEFIEKLEEFKPMKFSISYHSDKKEHWCKIFNLSEEKYMVARNCFHQLLQKQFIIEGVIVPLPALVGYEDLENTIRNLCCYTKRVLIYAPGYSKLVSNELKDMIYADYTELSHFFQKMRKRYKIFLDYMSDPLKPLGFAPYNFMVNSFNSKFKNVLWLFSEAAYTGGKKILEGHIPHVPNNHYAAKVKNKTYGGNINAAGLLMVDDFDKAVALAIKKYTAKNINIDLLILPRIAFDRYGDDLIGKNHSILEEKYKLPTWLG